MSRCLVVPAAGEATRWGAALKYKELLPLKYEGEYKSLLQYSIQAGINGGATTALVITKESKVQAQVGNIQSQAYSSNLDVFYTMQPEHKRELWGAMQCSFKFRADRYLFAMPDTFFPPQIFTFGPQEGDFWLGIFETTLPGRFGIVDSKNWINDKGGLLDPGPTYAWGVAAWSSRVVEFWKEYGPYDYYEEAWNHAALHFGCKKTVMDYYFDCANYEEYLNLLKAGDYASDYILHARQTLRPDIRPDTDSCTQ